MPNAIHNIAVNVSALWFSYFSNLALQFSVSLGRVGEN